MRPANIVTSVADVLAGIAISGYLVDSKITFPTLIPILLLSLSTIGLYGGGVVFNDVFDAELDKLERPERPIPSGEVSLKNAVLLGSILLLIGVITAAFVNSLSLLLAILVAVAALVYDKFSKPHSILGPLNMGLCRGLNLLLGVSIVTSSVCDYWFLAFIPIIYIAAITMISRGEVHGGNKRTLYFAALFYLIVIAGILILSSRQNTIYWCLLFLLPFAWIIFSSLIKAVRLPSPKNIGVAVKSGVLALILMNASWAAAFDSISLAFLILLLLPLSLWLARLFAVT